jgi:predicted AAA+ superfamily ATPase
MNEIQNLIDEKTAQFILSGSSARKLKHQNHINILPGRVFLLYLDPLSDPEIIQTSPYDISYSLEDRLYFGSLPAITLEKNPDYRSGDLKTYVQTYLEDEVRREALVRNLAQFGRFLELAAAQSGEIINLTKLSQEIGVAHTTIANYYQILEDCLIVKRVDSYAHTKTRRRLTKSPKYLFFDLGVRRLAAREGYPVSTTQIGHLFEQWIGLELLKWINLHEASRPQLFFWRDNSGTEVDWVIKKNNDLIPIEVKWTEQPSEQDIKYLKIFIQEYECSHGYLVCRTPHALALTDKITAIPWASLGDYLN